MYEEDNLELDRNELQNEAIERISFVDKVVGIFTSPGATMENTAKFPARTMDWILPVIAALIAILVSTYLTDQNTELKIQKDDYELSIQEKSFDLMVESGSLTRDKADEMMDGMYESRDNQNNFDLIKISGAVFGIFIMFFIVTLIFFLWSRFVLGGTGTYSDAMSAYGISYYILTAQVILSMILSLATENYYIGLSLLNFFEVDIFSFNAFILRKLDPFTIWFYIVLGIALAKMFKSENSMKYVISTFSIWIGSSLLFYYLSTLSAYLIGLRFM